MKKLSANFNQEISTCQETYNPGLWNFSKFCFKKTLDKEKVRENIDHVHVVKLANS